MINALIDKEELYHNYHQKVRAYIINKVPNIWETEDLVSEVFLKVFTNIDAFDNKKASVSTWIYTITRNTVIDYFRKHKIIYELPLDIADNCAIDDKLLKEETLDILADGLEILDKRSRDLIILHYYKKYTLKDIALKMSLSYAMIKIIHKKAIAILRNHFEQF